MGKNKHLILSERIDIEIMLGKNTSFRKIALALDKSTTTISNEIKSHLVFKKSGAYGRSFCDCKNRYKCDKCFTCQNSECRIVRRRTCTICYKYCKSYEKELCAKLRKAPFVCNGCDLKMACTLEKRYYQAKIAQKEYETLLSESRSGITYTEEELLRINDIIVEPIKNGQSIHHVYEVNKNKIMMCERNLYNIIGNKYIDLTRVDLPRTIQRDGSNDPRKKGTNFKVDKKCRIGRTYEDFLNFIKENPCLPITQMDSVIGRIGGKVLLTIHFVIPELMIAFLREHNDAQSVEDNIDLLYDKLGRNRFLEIIPLLLGDNGSEFSNPLALEIDKNGEQRTHVFYCDPSSPYQKGAIENNHEFLRRILPKGTNFDDLTQDKINLAMSHINSYNRQSLGNKSPYKTFRFMYGQKALDAFGLKYINANDIVLRPKLLNM